MTTWALSLVSRVQQSATGPTLTEVGPLPFTSLNWTDKLNEPPTLDAELSLDNIEDAVKAYLVNLIGTPSEIRLYKDSEVAFQGPLLSVDVQEGTVSVSANGLETYLQMMRQQTDYGPLDDDQSDHVATLVGAYQAQTYGNFGISLAGLSSTGVTRQLTLQAENQDRLWDIIVGQGGRDDGYDTYVDPVTRQLVLAHPQRGVDQTDTRFLDRRVLSNVRVGWHIGVGDVASEFTAVTTLQDQTVLSQSASDTTTRATFGRVAEFASYFDIVELPTLLAHAKAELAFRTVLPISIDPEIVPVEGMERSEVEVGDWVTYQYDAGLGLQTVEVRLGQMTVSLAETSETFGVVFA